MNPSRLAGVSSELLAGLSVEQSARLGEVGTELRLAKSESLLTFGTEAKSLYLIRSGELELTFPLLVMGEKKEVRFQILGPGRAVAWSALVPPHQLTMSAKAVTDLALVAFAREPLQALMAADPKLALVLVSNIAKIVAGRLQEVQSLWVREVQRNVSETYR